MPNIFMNGISYLENMASEMNTVLNRLEEIKGELTLLRKQMRDVDTVLTDDDLAALQDADQDFAAGRAVKL